MTTPEPPRSSFIDSPWFSVLVSAATPLAVGIWWVISAITGSS